MYILYQTNWYDMFLLYSADGIRKCAKWYDEIIQIHEKLNAKVFYWYLVWSRVHDHISPNIVFIRYKDSYEISIGQNILIFKMSSVRKREIYEKIKKS